MTRRIPRILAASAAAIVSLLAAPLAFARQEPAAPPAPEATAPAGAARPWRHADSDLPTDPRIHWGVLPNGMRFAWAEHGEPQDRLYLRLHVDAGSYAERAGERGMAHFLEHMAFNGLRNFPAGTLIEWFQRHGMSFGADTNAHTGFSETVYKLDLPAGDLATLREGLRVMRDFADGLLLEEAEVQAEKGVIDGEERERDSAGLRAFVAAARQLYGGSLLPERLPIGDKADRDAFTASSVQAFYQRWYRPENCTLIAVGDLDGLNPEAAIRAAFADWKAPATPVELEPEVGVAGRAQLFFSVREEELPQAQVSLAALHPFADEPDTAARRRREALEDLACAMVNLRYAEKAKEEGTPYLYAGVGRTDGMRVWEGGELAIGAAPERWEEAFLAAHLELRAALNFGFQQAELDEVRADTLRALDEMVEREATAPSAGLREAILLAVEEGVTPTSAADLRELLAETVRTADLESCLAALRGMWPREAQTSLSVIGPSDLGPDAPAHLAELLDRSRKARPERPAALADAPFAYPSDPARTGAVARRAHVEDLDLHCVAFANGVLLNVKSTDFKERQILLRARVGEGYLAFEGEDLITIGVASNGLDGAGLAAHRAEDLRRLFAGKQVGWTGGVSADHAFFEGQTTGEDLLAQFELLAARLAHPGWREEGLQPFLKQLPLIEQVLKSQPIGPLVSEFLPEYLSGDPRIEILGGLGALPPIARMAEVTMAAVAPLIGAQYADGPLEITVVGDVDPEAVVAAAARTVGLLPARRARLDDAERRKLPALPRGMRMDRTIETEDQRGQVFLFFPLTDGMEARNRRLLGFLSMVVDDRLRLEVRERLGAAYAPSSAADLSRTFPGFGLLLIQAATDPTKVEELLQACRQVAADLAQKGVTAEEVDRLKGPLMNQIRDQRRTNEYWLRELGEAQSAPASLDNPRSVLPFYEEMDLAALSALAAQYLQPAASSVLVVLPR